MALREYKPFEENYQIHSEEELPLFQEYVPESETAPRLSELLFFFNIAAFCVLTAIFSFLFLSFKLNAFLAFSMALASSFAITQTYRAVIKKKR